jgi:coniferyl-aldehyde dehydrogenase
LSEAPEVQGSDSICLQAFNPIHQRSRVVPPPTYRQRIDLLNKLQQWILSNKEKVASAIHDDFGSRSRHETLLAEVFIVVNGIKHTKKHLRQWMRSESQSVFWAFLPARARIVRQPLGVVGIISPWNYPFQLALLPIVAAVSAGNRFLLKPSELTPSTSLLLKQMCEEIFEPDFGAVVLGGPEIGAAFSSMPFDHLFYTGSTHVGRLVSMAAAKNLTPVTLELGGKSPVIVHSSYDTRAAVAKIGAGKFLNAGQTCLAPDYVLLAEKELETFVQEMERWVQRAYPTLMNNDDYSSIINARHHKRLLAHVEDAKAKGARVITINPGGESEDTVTNKMFPTLIVQPTDDMTVMQDELFGPVLPVRTVASVNEAIQYVNARPRPLGLYYFDNNASRVDKLLEETVSGGATINDVIYHVAQEDLPFGGVGDSGSGSYHGEHGFLTFTHQKSVFYQSKLATTHLFNPPYGSLIDRVLSLLIR